MYDMRRTTLFLDDKLQRQLRDAARKRGTSVAQLVREALTLYLAGGVSSPAALPTIAGRFASGAVDTADRVDELLWQDPHG
jgi:hypothetical protein